MNETRATPTEKLADDFHTVLAETEELLKSVASLGNEKAGASIAHAKAATATAERYVQDNPWRAVGIVVLVGALAGFVAGLAVSRR